MRHASLFSGIGGFDLAAQWMGWENVFQVEIDGFCQKVLEKNFPGVARYGDIKQFDGTKYRGAVDILTGGFPCQSFSLAGKGAVDLSLWKEMFRVVGEVRPKVIVAENVFGILARKKGMALSMVYSDLEGSGYQTMPPLIIPACAVDAPHRRDRVWIITYSNRNSESIKPVDDNSRRGELGVVTDSIYTGSQNGRTESVNGLSGERTDREANTVHKSATKESGRIPGWSEFPTQPLICGRDDGIPHRVEQISGFGNAIVPQVAFEIFKAIEAIKPD